MSPQSLILVFFGIFTVSCQDLLIFVGDTLPAVNLVYVKNLQMSTLNIENISRPIAIDYDDDRKDLYWADVLLRQIWSRNLETSLTKLILTLKESSVLGGLAVDASRRKIFYTDEGNDVIGVINTDGSGHEVVLDTGHDQPRAIVLHEERREIYWTDWGDVSYIASASYDGSNITKIITTGLGWPNGLTLDKKNDVLYWCDAKAATIEAVNVNGTGRRLVISEPNTHYFDIFYHDEALFFTDWTRRAIMSIPTTGGRVGFIQSDTFDRLTGIHVVSTMQFSHCLLGQFGVGCNECGHCKQDSVCDKTTGVCLAGCSAGYTGRQCMEECPSGRYGLGCMECGHCKEDSVCDKTSGNCSAGCSAGYTGTQCVEAIEANSDNTKIPTEKDDAVSGESSLNSNHVILIGAVAGSVLALLVVVVAIIVIVVIVLRKTRQVPKSNRGLVTFERNQNSLAPELPSEYATISDLSGPRADNSRLTEPVDFDNSLYLHPNAECEEDTGYLTVTDGSNGKSYSAVI